MQRVGTFTMGNFVGKTKTPLHLACANRRADIVTLLLQQGADTNAIDEIDRTPLHWASINGQPDIIALLLQHDANVNAADEFGFSPLHFASKAGSTDIVQLLLQRGADVNAVSKCGLTPLHLASSVRSTDIMRLLLRWGADANAVDEDDFTPLHWVCLSWETDGADVVKILIDEGANINAVNILGRTPLDEAMTDGQTEVVIILREVQGAVQDLSDHCAHDATFDFEQYFASYQGNDYRLTENAVEASDELKTSRAYKHYTFEKARKRLRSQKIKIFSDGQVREDGTIFPLTPIDIEALVRAYAVVGRDMFASDIPGCVPIMLKSELDCE